MRIESFERLAFVALRIVAGLMFSCHGMQKLFGALGATSHPAFGTQLWIGGVIELVCGLTVALGLFTRVAALLSSGTMAVAYVQFHWKLTLAGWRWVPIINKGEMALLYCLVFLLIAIRGSVAVSLDRSLRRTPT
jgi:putative oxidoreductase